MPSPTIVLLRETIDPLLKAVNEKLENPGNINQEALVQLQVILLQLNQLNPGGSFDQLTKLGPALKDLPTNELQQAVGNPTWRGSVPDAINGITIPNGDTARFMEELLNDVETKINSLGEPPLNTIANEALSSPSIKLPGALRTLISTATLFVSPATLIVKSLGRVNSAVDTKKLLGSELRGSSLKEIIRNVWSPLAGSIRNKTREALNKELQELQQEAAENVDKALEHISLQIDLSRRAIGTPQGEETNLEQSLKSLNESIKNASKLISDQHNSIPVEETQKALRAVLEQIEQVTKTSPEDPNYRENVVALTQAIKDIRGIEGIEEIGIVLPEEVLEKTIAKEPPPPSSLLSRGLGAIGGALSYLNPFSYFSSKEEPEPPSTPPLINTDQINTLRTRAQEGLERAAEVVKAHGEVTQRLNELREKAGLLKSGANLNTRLNDLEKSLQELQNSVKKYNNCIVRFFGWVFQTKGYTKHKKIGKLLKQHEELSEKLEKEIRTPEKKANTTLKETAPSEKPEAPAPTKEEKLQEVKEKVDKLQEDIETLKPRSP